MLANSSNTKENGRINIKNHPPNPKTGIAKLKTAHRMKDTQPYMLMWGLWVLPYDCIVKRVHVNVSACLLLSIFSQLVYLQLKRLTLNLSYIPACELEIFQYHVVRFILYIGTKLMFLSYP